MKKSMVEWATMKIGLATMTYPVFRNLPAVGNGVKLLDEVKQVLICNWDGCVVIVTAVSPWMLPEEHLLPADKGTPAAYGVDAIGRVICSIIRHPGDARSESILERGLHFEVNKADRTRG